MHVKRKETTMHRNNEIDREYLTIYRATVTDTISRQPVETFVFGAGSIEDAREKAWRIAGRKYNADIHVRVGRVAG
jgi:hypothetical protein